MKKVQGGLSTPMSCCAAAPSKDGGDAGVYGHHTVPSVSKPADVGQGDLRKKFFHDVPGTPATLETPMQGTAALDKRRKK